MTRELIGTLALVGIASTAAAQPTLRFDGCDGRIDADEVRARVRMELDAQQPGLGDEPAEVHVACDGRAAEITVVRRARAIAGSRVDLREVAGAGGPWAIALVIAELLHPPADRPRPALETAEPVSPPRALASGLDPPAPSTRPVTPRGRASRPETWERPPDRRADSPGRPRPRTWLSIGAVGRLTFEGPSAAAGAHVAVGHEWFRAGLTVGGTHRGHPLGDIGVGIFLLDVAVLPLRYVDPTIAAAGEIFAHGGLVYGAGAAATPAVHASDAVTGLVGVGFGARIRIALDPSVAVELGLRGGYEPFGPALRADADTVVHLHGFFASLDAALSLPID